MNTFQHDISRYIEGLAEHSSDIIWIKNTDFTKQIYISPAYEEIWGRSCDSMYADPKSWIDYVFPEDLERLHATVEKCRQNITPETKYTETYRIKRPDGKVFWIKERAFAIYDNFDNLIGFGGVTQDITHAKKNKRAEAEVQVLSEARETYEEYLRSIIDSIAGNHWWKDREGVYRGYNRTLLKSLGYRSPSDIIGKTDYELPWADQADSLVALDREVMRRGVSIEREETVLSNTGQERVYLVNKTPLRNFNGDIIGTIGHGFDITEIKNVQRELEKTKNELEKEKNNVEDRLNAVIEALSNRHWVKDLEGHYLACSNTLAQMFGLSDVSDIIGKTDYELPWSKDADEIVAFDEEVISKGVEITKDQKATKKDGVVYYCRTTKIPLRDREGKMIGILSSEVDITDQKNLESDKTKELEKLHVLLVEDNALNQRVIVMLLKNLDCSVTIASNGEEAIEKAGSGEQYDLILMDIGLPGIDGVAVTEHLRSQEALKTVPIVAQTAHVFGEKLQRCLDAGMNKVLIKPVSIHHLKQVLEQYCPAREARRSGRKEQHLFLN